MKITLKTPVLLSRLIGCLLLCSTILITGCNKDPHICVKCNAAFAHQKNVKQILHYDTELLLKEKFRFYYKENLVDSIVKVSYGTDSPGDSTTARLKVYYPSGDCIPSSYIIRTDLPNSPVSIEKGNMLVSGSYIINKHLSYYWDEGYNVANKSADIDYSYNSAGKVTKRNGTDYSLLVGDTKYSNENAYTYTGDNITKIVTQKEQAGYNLTIAFDNNNNPFNIQGGVLYYLNLTSYPDEEFFESICRDRNNPTTMAFQGTDASNSVLTMDITFTYTYTADHYPLKVNILEVHHDAMWSSDTEINHGTYQFTYY